MAFGKDRCSICGKYTDITTKVLNEQETLYCKDCQDKELKIMLVTVYLLLHVKTKKVCRAC